MKKALKVLAVAVAGYAVKNRKVIEETVKATIEATKASARIASGNSDYRYETVNGVNVIVQDDAVIAVGSLYGVATKNELGEPVVVVSEDFFELPENVRNFVLAHEEGHVKLHLEEGQSTAKEVIVSHAKNIFRGIQAKAGKVDQRELEADMYAVGKVGVDAVIEGLYHLREAVESKFGRTLGVKEIDNRIVVIKALKGGE